MSDRTDDVHAALPKLRERMLEVLEAFGLPAGTEVDVVVRFPPADEHVIVSVVRSIEEPPRLAHQSSHDPRGYDRQPGPDGRW